MYRRRIAVAGFLRQLVRSSAEAIIAPMTLVMLSANIAIDVL
jgi:hypothetical protein